VGYFGREEEEFKWTPGRKWIEVDREIEQKEVWKGGRKGGREEGGKEGGDNEAWGEKRGRSL